MFMNLSFLGYSFLSSLNPTLNNPVLYNKATIYGGNTGITIANIWGRNKTISSDVISNYDILTYKPTWDVDTYALAQFKNNLDIGNITDLTNPMTEWVITRKATDEKISKQLAIVDVDTPNYEDFLSVTGKTYDYSIIAKNDSEISSPVSANISPNYYGWFLIDEEKGVSYKFDANLNSGSMGYEEDVTWYNNNTQYPVSSKGKINAFTVQINAILFDPMSKDNPYDYVQSNQILDNINEFIKSSRTKILKDRRGRIWRGEAFANGETQVNDGLAEQIVSINFTFKETAKV